MVYLTFICGVFGFRAYLIGFYCLFTVIFDVCSSPFPVFPYLKGLIFYFAPMTPERHVCSFLQPFEPMTKICFILLGFFGDTSFQGKGFRVYWQFGLVYIAFIYSLSVDLFRVKVYWNSIEGLFNACLGLFMVYLMFMCVLCTVMVYLGIFSVYLLLIWVYQLCIDGNV